MYLKCGGTNFLGTDICISLTDLPWYKEYILHHKVKYCVCRIPMTVEYGLTTFMER